MNLGIPQLIILGLVILSWGIHIAKHGDPKVTKWNFWLDLISSTINLGLLWWGGFFH